MRSFTRLRTIATQVVVIRQGDRALVRKACGTTLGACKKIGDPRVAQIFSSSRVLPHQNRMPLALLPRPDQASTTPGRGVWFQGNSSPTRGGTSRTLAITRLSLARLDNAARS